jgi:hypothetical protein
MADAWLRRWLSRCSLGLAAGLVVLVLVAPWLGTDKRGGTLSKLLTLFGHDVTVRRTGLATAAGLAVTARVFFRPEERPPRPPRRAT